MKKQSAAQRIWTVFLYCKNIMHINWEFHQIQYVHTQAVHLHTASKVQKNRREEKNESKMERYTYFEIERRFFWDPMNIRNKEISLLYRKNTHYSVCALCFFLQLSTNKISTRSKEIALWTQLIFHIKWLSLACMYCSFQSLILFTS